jgi:CrcB protein
VKPWLSAGMLVGAGGFVGSVLRYALSGLVHRAAGTAFPYGTLVVNVTGCLAIGLLGGLTELRQVAGPELRLFLLIGILGGFTTFSTFGYETLALLRDGDLMKAVANAGLHLTLGLGAAWLGFAVAEWLGRG